MIKNKYTIFLLSVIAALMIYGCDSNDISGGIKENSQKTRIEDELDQDDSQEDLIRECSEDYNQDQQNTIDDIPSYSGEAYVIIDNNNPDFSSENMITDSFEMYSDLDNLGRCGLAYANVGTDIMPTEKRGSIGQVKPSGWHTIKYDSVDGKYLYNRCHLIGYQLSAENANEKNLITGTRYMNVEGMLPFENLVADYVKETNNHVLYRVTPVFEDDDLLAKGVQMEAYSVEDEGEGVCFNVFVYNVQPGINIDYKAGESWEGDAATDLDDSEETNNQVLDYSEEEKGTQDYILNTNTKKFHHPKCRSVSQMNEENRESFNGPRQWLIDNGYSPCGNCNP